MYASRCGTLRVTYDRNGIMVENAELQPSYEGNQANIKTVLKKQNKTVKGGYFFENINVIRKHKKKSTAIFQIKGS